MVETMELSKFLSSTENKDLRPNSMARHTDNAEEYMGSRDWIGVNGLKIKRLSFYDLLGKVAFRHCDGVVRLQDAPEPEEFKTDAVSVHDGREV